MAELKKPQNEENVNPNPLKINRIDYCDQLKIMFFRRFHQMVLYVWN